jgi:hypothetical protein
MGAAILAAIPPQFQAAVQPFIGAMVQGVYGAFSLATAQAFWLGVVGSIAALVAALGIKEIPLRTTNEVVVPTAPVAGGVAPVAKPEPVTASTAIRE